jgi:O-antigen ligase
MTAIAVDRVLRNRVAITSPAIRLLQVFAVTAMVFPSDTVIKAVGGGGYVGALVAYLLFLGYIAATVLGLHDPFERRSPVRIALCALWIAALISYALMDRTLLSSEQLSSADRWLIQLVGISGVVLVASEFAASLDDIHKVLRAITWGGAFCGLVSALQFWLHYDVTPYIRRILPGFSLNQAAGAIAIGGRSGLNRVAGTATDPIEMGVVASMLLPLAIYLAINDKQRSVIARWLPVCFIAVAIPIAISRAAILGVVLALGVYIIMLPPIRRLTVLAAVPVALCAIFLSAHRLLGTLTKYFTLGTSDNSVSHRVNNLPYAEHLISEAPWFGHGDGTYIAVTVSNLGLGHILDDQYLDTAIELGLVGVGALIFFFLWPTMTAFAARGHTTDPQVRELCAALGGAALAGIACSATFDALSFPMFVMVEALVIGLCGAVWLLASSSPASTDIAQLRDN